MPIYEYTCTDCGHDLEVMQKMNELPLEKCPACGQNTLKKLISATVFHLKGNGWYQTDFKGQRKSGEPVEHSEAPAAACNSGGCCACAQSAA